MQTRDTQAPTTTLLIRARGTRCACTLVEKPPLELGISTVWKFCSVKPLGTTVAGVRIRSLAGVRLTMSSARTGRADHRNRATAAMVNPPLARPSATGRGSRGRARGGGSTAMGASARTTGTPPSTDGGAGRGAGRDRRGPRIVKYAMASTKLSAVRQYRIAAPCPKRRNWNEVR